jgi:hypothetical protein
MSTGRHSFKHNDAARLIRATTAAGLKVKAVTMRDGKPYVEIVDEATAKANAEPNDWADLKDATDEKRAS